MRRHWHLIRLLLLRLEGADVDLSGWSEREIAYHRYLLVDSGLAEGARMIDGDAVLNWPTEAGHDFLSWARDDKHWAWVMDFIRENDLPETFAGICDVAQVPPWNRFPIGESDAK